MFRRTLDFFVRPQVTKFVHRTALRLDREEILFGAQGAAIAVNNALGSALRGDSTPLEEISQSGAVDAVEEGEKRKGLADFVFLQVADEVPLQAGWAGRYFVARFLHAALAEDALAGGGCCGDRFSGIGFGDCNEPDGRRIAPGTLRRGGQPAADFLQVGRDGVHQICL